MPTRNEIYSAIAATQSGAPDKIRREYLAQLQELTRRDTILYSSGFMSARGFPPALLPITSQDIQGFMGALHGLGSDQLDLILHSPGGSLEATEQIVKYLRNKYQNIRAIVPQNAMSAATMLACACDEILMGKHSALGPIDPQITFNTGSGSFTAPAQSILDAFNQAKEEIRNDPAAAAIWIKRIDRLPHGFLQICRNTIQLSEQRVSEWLTAWMLKAEPNGKTKAQEIARWLSDANAHLSHGRPFDCNDARQHGLRITLLEDDQNLQNAVLSVFHATMATHDFTTCAKLIENHTGKGSYYSTKQ